MQTLIVLLFFTSFPDTLYLFYSPECPHCNKIINILAQADESIPVIKFNLDEEKTMMLLDSIEHVLGQSGDKLPVILYKNRLYYGKIPWENKSNEFAFNSNICTECDKRNTKDIGIINNQQGIYYVYTPGCQKCSKFARKLTTIEKDLKIKIDHISTFDSLGIAIIHFLKQRGLYKKVPLLLIGDTVLYTPPENASVFRKIIRRHMTKPTPTKWEKKFNPTLFTTIAAGLIDGINPCAFTVLLFLIGFIVYKGKEKRVSTLILIFFSLGIFVAYFVIGLGLFWILEFIGRIKLLNTILRGLIGGFAIILAVLSIKDGIMLIKGSSNTTLELPMSQKQKTHRIIKKYANNGFMAGSFLTGLSISFVEFACTGQIYLPTLSYISKHEGLTIRRLVLLVIYNISFIIPLIFIGVLAIFAGHNLISKKMRRNTPFIKFVTGALFLLLGVLVIFF